MSDEERKLLLAKRINTMSNNKIKSVNVDDKQTSDHIAQRTKAKYWYMYIEVIEAFGVVLNSFKPGILFVGHRQTV